MNNLDFFKLMDETRLIAILRGIPREMLCDVLDAMYDGGIRLAEITYDYSGKIPSRETAEMIGLAVKHTEGRMLIGAGTVVSSEQLELTSSVGGRFIISPHVDSELIAETKRLGLYSIPGAMSVTEIKVALDAGADYVKIFPAGSLGADFVRYTLGPLSTAKLVAVAFPLEEIPAYLDAGCVGFGIGGAIANASLCAAGRLDLIRENAARYAKAARG